MKVAFLKLHIAILFGGLTGVFGKLISFDSFVLSLYRSFIAICLLFLLLHFKKQFKLPPVKFIRSYLLAGCILGIHWLFFYGSIKLSNISIGVVTLSAMGFFTAILEPIVLKHKFSKLDLLFAFAAILGVAVIFGFDSSYRLGIIVGLIGAFLASVFLVINKSLVNSFDTRIIFFFELIGVFLLLLILAPIYTYFFSIDEFIGNTMDFTLLFCLASFCTVGLYLLQLDSSKMISAFTINLSFNLEPIYSILIAFIFLNEAHEVDVYFYVGILLIALSVIAQSLITIIQHKKGYI